MNLALEFDKSSKHEKEHSLLPTETKPQAFEVAYKGICLGLSEGQVNFRGPTEGALQVRENPELKQFASDFLSLYCSEVPANVNSPSDMKVKDQKKHDSMSEEDKIFKKHDRNRRCYCLSTKKNLEYETGEFLSNPSQELNTCSNPIEFQASLRKCTIGTKSVIKTMECHTPGSSIIKACAHRIMGSIGTD